MKHFILPLCLLVLGSCTKNGSTHSAHPKTMLIQSLGEIEIKPDRASFQIDLDCLDKSIQVSKKCLLDKSNALKTQLLALGIQEEDIQTGAVNLMKSYTWRNGSQEFEGYRSSITVHVTVKQIEQLSEIYSPLLDNSNLSLHNLQYTHSRLDSLKNEAYVKALQNSARTADKLLAEMPETKKEIIQIGNVEINSKAPAYRSENLMMKSFETDANSPADLAVSIGMIKVSATLYVEYGVR